MFKRTKSYDNLLTTLIGAGIRILFSSCQEETADLLKELCLLEQRKNVGIQVPTVNSNKWEALQFYLSIPNVSYITALNMCHQFSSVKKMTNRYVCVLLLLNGYLEAFHINVNVFFKKGIRVVC